MSAYSAWAVSKVITSSFLHCSITGRAYVKKFGFACVQLWIVYKMHEVIRFDRRCIGAYNNRVETQEGGIMPKLKLKNKLHRAVATAVALTIVLSCSILTANLSKRVRVQDGERELTLQTYTTSTHRILSQADITLDSLDEVERKEQGDTIYIEVLRAYPVHITYHNKEYVEFVTGGTVSDVLESAGIRLSADDVINHSGDTELFDGIEIMIDEVKYITKTDVNTVKYNTKYESSSDYPQGYEEVVTKGKVGKTEVTTTYRYVNGEFDSVCGEIKDVISKPKAKVVLQGTAQTAQASNITTAPQNTSAGGTTTGSTNSGGTGTSSGGTISGMKYSKVLTGSATAYTASSGALTSTGVPAYVGGVAVNPNIIPYGSKLYIVADGYTYGYATAVDTGGALMSGSALVDLYMSSYDECINFGRRNVKVYILD